MLNANDIRVELFETTTERDLGVMVNNKLKWNYKIDSCVIKPNNMLVMLKKHLSISMLNHFCNFTKHMSDSILNTVCLLGILI